MTLTHSLRAKIKLQLPGWQYSMALLIVHLLDNLGERVSRGTLRTHLGTGFSNDPDLDRVLTVLTKEGLIEEEGGKYTLALVA